MDDALYRNVNTTILLLCVTARIITRTFPRGHNFARTFFWIALSVDFTFFFFFIIRAICNRSIFDCSQERLIASSRSSIIHAIHAILHIFWIVLNVFFLFFFFLILYFSLIFFRTNRDTTDFWLMDKRIYSKGLRKKRK